MRNPIGELKGTTTVGVVCSDGVILATDTRATMGRYVASKKAKKIYKITSFGKKRLKEVIKDNLESSMNTLGDFIRTVVHTWMPNEERINRVMACFPFECSLHDIRVDDADYSLANIERIQRKINELEYTRHKVKSRLDEIDKRISENKILLTKLKNMREENMKTIPIVDDEEFENF